jgi:putative glutamine amidotransferase
MRTTVGITTGLESIDYQEYGRAIERLGAVPVFLHPGNCSPQDAPCVLKDLSGLLLAGGKDVHPLNYLPRTGVGCDLPLSGLRLKYHIDSDPLRDTMEMALIENAVSLNIPILGICRGFQILNVTFGGRLIMDIQTEIRHTKYSPKKSAVHSIRMVKPGRMAGILGIDEIMVNSRHHQGITDTELAPRLKASAYAPDGIIEAAEGTSAGWITAVQWHPERKDDDFIYQPCKKLFEAFISACEGC